MSKAANESNRAIQAWEQLRDHLARKNDSEGTALYAAASELEVLTLDRFEHEKAMDALMRVAHSIQRIALIVDGEDDLFHIKGEVANAACCLEAIGNCIDVYDGFWELVNVNIGLRK